MVGKQVGTHMICLLDMSDVRKRQTDRETPQEAERERKTQLTRPDLLRCVKWLVYTFDMTHSHPRPGV